MRRELLPELISDILLRLPARSLLRFRCISNSVRQEIDSPNFAQFHLNRSIETRSHRKVIFEGSEGIYAVDYDAGVRIAVKFNPRFTDKSISIKEFEFGAIQTCYGLILFRAYNFDRYDDDSGDSLLLWNPATRRFKLLPPCPFGIPCLDSWYGLGYDSAAHDYKVVSVYNNGVHQRFCVFSLKSNCWGQTQDLDSEFLCMSVGFANGFLYWTYYSRETVACFDMANEVFFDMANGFEEEDAIYINLSVAEDIVILHKNCEGKDDDEFYSLAAVDGNWSKTLMFKWPNRNGFYHSEEVIPLAFSKDGAYVMLGIGKHLMCIYWYNMEKKTMSRLKCSRDVSDCCVLLGESLVSLDNHGIFQVQGNKKRTANKGSGSGGKASSSGKGNTSMVVKCGKQDSFSVIMQRSLDTEEEDDELVRTFNEGFAFDKELSKYRSEIFQVPPPPPQATSTQPAATSRGNNTRATKPCTTKTAGNTTRATKPTTSKAAGSNKGVGGKAKAFVLSCSRNDNGI